MRRHLHRTQMRRAGLLLLACGAMFLGWLLCRDAVVAGRLRAALAARLPAGMAVHTGAMHWRSFWQPTVQGLWVTAGSDTVAVAEAVHLELRPRLAAPGRAWVQHMRVQQLVGEGKGWILRGELDMAPAHGVAAFNGRLAHIPQQRGDWELYTQGEVACHFGGEPGARQAQARVHLDSTHILHPRLGNDIKVIRELDAWAQAGQYANALALRPGTCLRVGGAHVQASGRYHLDGSSFRARLALPSQPADGVMAVARALAPAFLDGLVLRGDMAGDWSAVGDLDHLWDLQLHGHCDGAGLQLLPGGPLDPEALRARAHAPGTLGLDFLPRGLVDAVILAEDANFWHHHGFDADAVALAVAENVAQERFARGAGTIDMQLMRNVYLHHGKQLDRKVAEVALTWTAAQLQLLTKQEILTIYLNTIEWGPGIYGLTDAARYYFGKSPFALNTDEAIFLALIIPNPSHFDALLDEGGRLLPETEVLWGSMRWQLYELGDLEDEGLDAPYPAWPHIASLGRSV